MEKRELESRVERGIIFLRSREGTEGGHPELRGWPVRINRDLLDMSRADRCILGQTCGDFCEALGIFGLTLDRAEELGFWLGDCQYYPELTEAWRERLARMPEVQQAEEK